MASFRVSAVVALSLRPVVMVPLLAGTLFLTTLVTLARPGAGAVAGKEASASGEEAIVPIAVSVGRVNGPRPLMGDELQRPGTKRPFVAKPNCQGTIICAFGRSPSPTGRFVRIAEY